jgi:hypothetical protein
MYTLNYSTLDGFFKRKTFTTLAEAREWAKYWVGNPEIGSHYAVSADGIGKVTCTGCTLYELFDQKDWRVE